MANIRTCNKHNMIACVEKTAQNADFYQIIDFLTGCSINYSLLVDPDLIGLWLQQFWATASLKVINDVPHIRAKVAGKKILIRKQTSSWTYSLMMKMELNAFLSKLFGTCSEILATRREVDRPQDFVPSFHFSSKLLAAEEDIVLVLILRPASFARDAQGTPTKLLPHSQRYCVRTRLRLTHDAASIPKSPMILLPQWVSNIWTKQISSSKPSSRTVQIVCRHSNLGWNMDKGNFVEEHFVQNEDNSRSFFDDFANKDAAVTPDVEPKRRKLTLQQISAWKLKMMRRLLNNSSEWDAEEERKRFEELKENKAKDYFEETYFSCSRKKSNDEFLKTLFPRDSEERKGDVEGKRCKGLLRKRRKKARSALLEIEDWHYVHMWLKDDILYQES
ncbi:hypothetical protein Tco_0565195 [Tanacetum coccineum]